MSEPSYFRLSSDQVALLVYVAGAPRALLNMPVRVDIEDEIDEEKILEALKLTVKRLPFCRIRMHEYEEEKFWQYYSDEEPTGIELVDMSDKSEEDVDEYLLDKAREPFPNNYNDEQLYDAKLIRRPGGKHTVFFNGYHMIMDSVGLITVITYFDKVYTALVNGTELPPEGIGPEKHIEKSWKYKESPKAQADIDWWRSVFSTEPHFTSMNPRPSVEYVEGKNYGLPLRMDQFLCDSLVIRIPAETVKKINDAALANNMSAQIYYALAVRTWLYLMSGSTDVCFDTTGARRSALFEKDCGMTMAHQIVWRSDIPGSSTFADALRKLDITQKDMYRHISVELKDFLPWTNERYGFPEDAIFRSLVFTYQPYFNTDGVGLKFTANHVNTGYAFQPLYLNLMPHDDSGDLYADYLYSFTYLDGENLKRFHEFMIRFILAGIESPDSTIDELAAKSVPASDGE
ncbi:MAG: hypothetical protein K6C36_10365 [Clostridia bacterium]|nr:hypothetical protein [Clostridia bacterium]